MKIKGLIFLASFLFMAALSLSQFAIVSAQTGPATAPVSYFTYYLRGKISYRLSAFLFPATNVNVLAKNQIGGTTFSAKTDRNGFYTLVIRQTPYAAIYVIKPDDGRTTRWTPAQYNLLVSRDINGLNFIGDQASASAKISN